MKTFTNGSGLPDASVTNPCSCAWHTNPHRRKISVRTFISFGAECTRGEFVSHQTHSRNDTAGMRCDKGFVSESFARKNVRNMDFDDRRRDSCNCISDSYRCMCVSGGVENDAVAIKSGLLNFADEFSLDIALEIIKLGIRELSFYLIEVIFKRFGSVNFRFTLAQQIEVGPVDDRNSHGRNVSLGFWCKLQEIVTYRELKYGIFYFGGSGGFGQTPDIASLCVKTFGDVQGQSGCDSKIEGFIFISFPGFVDKERKLWSDVNAQCAPEYVDFSQNRN